RPFAHARALHRAGIRDTGARGTWNLQHPHREGCAVEGHRLRVAFLRCRQRAAENGGSGMSARALEMRNLSGRRRFGCKGPAAESWLAAQGFGVAPGVNRWSIDSRGVLVARLTTSE